MAYGSGVRLLYSADDGPIASTMDEDALAEVYAYPDGVDEQRPWVRTNFVSTLDGAANGPDGLTGSINTTADRALFALLRTLADVVVVGAGTARTERYALAEPDSSGRRERAGRPPRPAMAVVTRSGDIPPLLREQHDDIFLVTCAQAPGEAVRAARKTLGDDHVIVCGDHSVDLRRLVRALAERGLPRILCEGGPHLMHDIVASGVLDELCLTFSPVMIGGDHPRILVGDPAETDLRLRTLIESDSCLLGRWLVGASGRATDTG